MISAEDSFEVTRICLKAHQSADEQKSNIHLTKVYLFIINKDILKEILNFKTDLVCGSSFVKL